MPRKDICLQGDLPARYLLHHSSFQQHLREPFSRQCVMLSWCNSRAPKQAAGPGCGDTLHLHPKNAQRYSSATRSLPLTGRSHTPRALADLPLASQALSTHRCLRQRCQTASAPANAPGKLGLHPGQNCGIRLSEKSQTGSSCKDGNCRRMGAAMLHEEPAQGWAILNDHGHWDATQKPPNTAF